MTALLPGGGVSAGTLGLPGADSGRPALATRRLAPIGPARVAVTGPRVGLAPATSG